MALLLSLTLLLANHAALLHNSMPPTVHAVSDGTAVSLDRESDPTSKLARLRSALAGSWDGRFGSPGVGGAITDVVTDDAGNVYVSGSFLTTGSLESGIIAMWDGQRWHTLGSGEIDGLILDMAIDSQGRLWAGGQFETIRGTAAKALAMWDGTAWSAVGTGLDNYMPTNNISISNEWIAALEFGDDGTLYAGGHMTSIDGVAVNNIAMFDGTSWSAMGGGLTCCAAGSGSAGVQTIAVGADNTVYAGGKFGETNTHGEFFERIVAWNGTNWSTLMHVAGPVIDIVVDGPRLYVGGDFSHMRPDFENGPSILANRMIHSTNGGAGWNTFGSEPNVGFRKPSVGAGAEVFDMKLGADGNLYVVGDFETVVETAAHNAVMWDGTSWTEVGGGVGLESTDTQVFSFAETSEGWYFGGLFAEVGDLAGVGNVALYTGNEWAALGAGVTYLPGVGGVVSSLSLGPNGDVYASGTFSSAGGVGVAGTAYFDGLRWNALGDMFAQPIDEIEVAADGTIYASGRFIRSDFSQFNVAMWDGAAWVEVGQLGTLASSPPMEIAVDTQGNLYAGGTAFQTLNGVPVSTSSGFANFVMWDGTEWSIAGGDADGSVRVIYVDDADNVYIGGTFDEVDGMAARGIAMWDGSTWTSFGLGFRDAVQAIVKADDGTLYAGGEFETTDFANPLDPNSGTPAKFVAKWDGSAWSQVGAGLDDEVNALAVGNDGTLYATGEFTADGSGTTDLHYIAGFDGTAWSALGDGLNSGGNALAFDAAVGLYVGGDFTVVDGQDFLSGTPSGGIALWRSSGTVAVEEVGAPANDEALLLPNYPNPFSTSTTIPYRVSQSSRVRVAVYDALGRHVVTLVDKTVGAGDWDASWNATGVANGLYFARLEVGGRVSHRSMTVIR